MVGNLINSTFYRYGRLLLLLLLFAVDVGPFPVLMPAGLLALTALVDDGVLEGVLALAHRTGAPLSFALDFGVLARALDALLLPMGRQYRVKLLPVFVHVGIVLTATVREDGLRGP